MEYVSHLMEERHHVIMEHQRGPLRSLFREVGDHCRDGVVSLCASTIAVKNVISRNEGPDRSMRVFIACEKGEYAVVDERKKMVHTSRKEIKVAITDET